MKLIHKLTLFALALPVVLSVRAADKWGTVAVEGTLQGLSVPSSLWVAVTPSNTVAIASGVPRAIYSHDGGDIACVDKNGTALPFLFAAGEIKPLRCVRVNVTSTTSATIYALY
jgi:hypothetical protein